MGVFLFIPFFLTFCIDHLNFRFGGRKFYNKINYLLVFLFKNRKLTFILLFPLLGLICYLIYLKQTTNDPLYFYHALSGFNTGRSIHRIVLLPQVYFRYISIFLKAPFNIAYFVAVLEFIFFNLFLIVLLYDLKKLWNEKNTPGRLNLLGLNIFSLINIILPTLTGTFTSIPRYSLFSLSFFIRIAHIKSLYIKIILLSIFTIFHILLLSLFIQGYFVG
jgi:hypothetical protein